MKSLLSIISGIFMGVAALAANPTKVFISGSVKDAATGESLAGVAVEVGEDYLWGITDENGKFSIDDIQPGRYVVKAVCLGYVDSTVELDIKKDLDGIELKMQLSSLALDEVVVTAKRTDDISTSHTMGRDALNHLQMSNMADMSALLPGGKTVNPDLTSENSFSLRSGGTSAGNAAFGTAVEVDGVRLGNNAAFSGMGGVDTRNIPVDNVESVEVITGVPSAEYGDLNGGMVKVHTRRGRTPVNLTFSVNPRTYQSSVSKGIDLGSNAGIVNVSAEWARATKKLDSPYQSYTRRGFSAVYSNTFSKCLRFEAGITGNLGGMNTEDDPDAFVGEYIKSNDNVLRANTSLTWLLNRPWVTSLKLEASVNYNDNKTHTHAYSSSASMQPAVHSESEGYHLASRLPKTYFSDQIIDSRELDAAASLKYTWVKRWRETKNNLKAGVQWKTNGNVGSGEYYEDVSLASNGYRPRPYSDYPFMHNLSAYAEDGLSLPLGSTVLDVTAGLRMENVFIEGTQYDNMTTFSPRLNARLKVTDHLAIRAGWGITEKLPSFYILYPKQEYRDIQTFGFSHGDGSTSSYIYYTQPYSVEYNPSLKWQRNSNSEFGIDIDLAGFNLALVGFYNVTKLPYRISSRYTPFTYDILKLPAGYSVPDDPQIRVDEATGSVYMREGDGNYWTKMDVKVTDRTFVKTTFQDNGADVQRAGVEMTLDCPEIRPIRTSVRLDATYNYSYCNDNSLSWYYNAGWSHTTLPNRSYQYVGIYANGSSSATTISGRETHNLDANLTTITHIPQARLVITCRVEMSLLTRTRNIAAGSLTELWPSYYMDLDGTVHPFTQTEASDPEFSHLILRPSNDYVFDQDGYGPYMSANLSITKEIGDHVSLSFFANNFTNSRTAVYSLATGVGTILTPSFYYGLTCRLKF